MEHLIWAGIGWAVGCFTPGVLRKVKAFFVGEAKVVETKAATYGADLKKKL